MATIREKELLDEVSEQRRLISSLLEAVLRYDVKTLNQRIKIEYLEKEVARLKGDKPYPDIVT